jgi:aminoglycoside phosphotransferase (APT) family kinase protein
MKASTSSYLHVMRKAIAETIAPELISDEAKRSAHILLGTLDELLKRETVTPSVLARAIPEGIAIARRLFTCLDQAGIRPDINLLKQLDVLENTYNEHNSLVLLRANYLALESTLETLMLPCLNPSVLASSMQLSHVLREVGDWKQAILVQQLTPLPADETPAITLQPLTAQKLRDFLHNCLSDEPALEVLDFYALPGGMSKQTYLFKLKRGNGNVEEMVARKDPSEPFLDFGCFNLRREFEFGRNLFEQGFPLPEPLWLASNHPGVTGSFYVMRKVAGSNTGSIFSTAAIPEPIMLQIAEALARLHRTPISAFRGFIEKHKNAALLTETASQSTRRYLLDLIEARKKAVRTPDSGETYLLAWALANIPENSDPPVPLHGDFTPHNCLWEDGHLTSVIDWECADFGDPVTDLAYLQPYIASRMDWDKFLGHYETHLGRKVNRASFGYYSMFLHLRTSVILNVISTRIENREAANIVALNIDYEYVPALSKMCLDATKL